MTGPDGAMEGQERPPAWSEPLERNESAERMRPNYISGGKSSRAKIGQTWESSTRERGEGRRLDDFEAGIEGQSRRGRNHEPLRNPGNPELQVAQVPDCPTAASRIRRATGLACGAGEGSASGLICPVGIGWESAPGPRRSPGQSRPGSFVSACRSPGSSPPGST